MDYRRSLKRKRFRWFCKVYKYTQYSTNTYTDRKRSTQTIEKDGHTPFVDPKDVSRLELEKPQGKSWLEKLKF